MPARLNAGVRNGKMNDNRTNGLGLWSHILLGACLSVVTLFALCFVMGGRPANAHERFALMGRSPIYLVHFSIPGVMIGSIVFGVRRMFRRRYGNSEQRRP